MASSTPLSAVLSGSGSGRLLAAVSAAGDLSTLTRVLAEELSSRLSGGIWCVLLRLRGDEMERAASRDLPDAVWKALDRLGRLEDVAAEPRMEARLENDPLWCDDAPLFAAAGVTAVWAVPVHGLDKAAGASPGSEPAVTGWVTYLHSGDRSPSEDHRALMSLAANLTGLALAAFRLRIQARYERFYDPLTRLPNRRLFSDELERGLEHASPRHNRMAVLLLDLDRFSAVNETLGLTVGDEVLQRVAARLADSFRPPDLLCRCGDDEFAVLLAEAPRDGAWAAIGERLMTLMRQPYDFSGEQVFVSASVGISVYPWHGEDGRSLMRSAEKALAVAKERGRNRFQLYSTVLGTGDHDNLRLLAGLPQVVERDELELLYQPQVSAGDGRILGVEALVYWHHPHLGVVSPARFVPLAEDAGLMGPITDWVLEQAMRQAAAWRLSGLHDLRMAVNVSQVEFREEGLVDRVEDVLARCELPAELLKLEITETTAMTDPSLAAERCRALARLGVGVAVDDFGTGYSSLAMLKKLDLRELKIDRSFVRNLPVNRESAAIVEAILALARALGLAVVAEGVENRRHAGFLSRRGCQVLQGYLFGKPQSAEVLSGMLRANLDHRSNHAYHPAYSGDDPLDETVLLGPTSPYGG